MICWGTELFLSPDPLSLTAGGVLIAKWRSASWGMPLPICRKQDLERLATRDHSLAAKEVEVECRVPSWRLLYMLQACLGRLSHSHWRFSQTRLSSLLSTPGHLPPCDCLWPEHLVCHSWRSCLVFVIFLWHIFYSLENLPDSHYFHFCCV